MKLKFRADAQDVLIFVIFAVFLLLVIALGVVNISNLASGEGFTINPFLAFTPEYFGTTIVFFIVALIALFVSVSSYFFDREEGIGFSVGKKDKGYSDAWFHHRGRNPHHYEYWTDNYDKGNVTCHMIPYKYVMEMLADWFAAGRTYRGKSFTVRQEVEWWREKKKNPNLAINPALIVFIDEFMNDVEYFDGIDWVKDEHNQQVLKYRLATHYEVNKQLNKS